MPGWSDWTTRRWLTAGVLVALTALVVLSGLGGWALDRAGTATSDLVNRSSPALLASSRLETALVDQQTGVRGYGLSGDTSFLQPYTQGLADQRAAVDRLRQLLGNDPTAQANLDAVLAQARTWQTDVAQPIAAAPPGAAAQALANREAQTDQKQFNAIRAAAQTQQAHLQAERDHAYAALQQTHTLRDGVLAAIGSVILFLAALVFAGLRRGVTVPLERLSSDVRVVSDGDFSHAVTPSGPADLRRLAEDVEGMRRRLAEELDFTDRARLRLDEQAAELRRSNSELEQFAYVASHDLQEPLRKVASFCQLLQRRYAGELDDRANQYIDFAVDGANRMQTLISDLLAFSRVGRVHRRYASVDLEQTLATTLDSLSLTAEETGAVITHDPLPTVTADATQMGMLLQNLIANAIKFRDPDRPPRVHLSARRDGEQWAFAVSDNGIGISPDYAERVFVIFQRLHTRDAYPGNGIGLAMCRKIVDFHGGTIAVDPDHSPGTRISFTLPVSAPTPASASLDGDGDSDSGHGTGAEGSAAPGAPAGAPA
ncbi:HAMP domain-containing protein [Streptacidiphilus sp. P02-A3a]|nr:HAMP domain-containing protein [Streptacidiphilus sp. P02-A3a]